MPILFRNKIKVLNSTYPQVKFRTPFSLYRAKPYSLRNEVEQTDERREPHKEKEHDMVSETWVVSPFSLYRAKPYSLRNEVEQTDERREPRRVEERFCGFVREGNHN